MYKVAIGKCDDYSSGAVNKALDEIFALLGQKYSFERYIKPGMTVFIKPNWVASRWRESCPHKDDLYSVITHPAVIEAVADRVAAALNGKGRVIIGDNPSIDADFVELMAFTGIQKLKGKYDIPCDILDLRPLVCKDLKDYGIKSKMHPQRGDASGEVEINLGRESLLYGVDSTLFRGVFNEREETVAAHTGGTQLYTLSRSLYDADVYISIPKLKTHQKAGVTLNLKGLVGSVATKNQLVHWRVGTPENGGDEYPDQASRDAAEKARVTHRGAHPGNDTIWRMVVDLYVAMQKKERKYFSVIDGIIAGEGQGPFCPHSKKTGVLLAGEDLLATDIAAARLMGINPRKIKYLEHFISHGYISMEDIAVMGGGYSDGGFFRSDSSYLDFAVPEQWKDIKV